MRLDEPLACHHLREHDLRGRAGGREDGADQEAAHVHPRHRQPAQPPGERNTGDHQGERAFAGDVDRQLAHPVEPDAGRQRKQHEGQDLHRSEPAHLRRGRVQQHRRSERQGQHRDLAAERADQDRGPQAPVRGLAQQIVLRQPSGQHPCPTHAQRLNPSLQAMSHGRSPTSRGGHRVGALDRDRGPVRGRRGRWTRCSGERWEGPALPLMSQRKLRFEAGLRSRSARRPADAARRCSTMRHSPAHRSLRCS